MVYGRDSKIDSVLWNEYYKRFVMVAKGKGGSHGHMRHVYGIPAIDILLMETVKRGVLIEYSGEGLEAWFLFSLLRSLENTK